MRLKVAEQSPKWGANYCPGYVGFVIRQYDFVSAGIQWFSKWDLIWNLPSPSHALIISGEDQTIEAFGRGVAYGTVSAYLNDPDCALLIRRPFRWTPGMGDAIVSSAVSHLGDKYGYALVAALAVANSTAGKVLDVLSFRQFSRLVCKIGDAKRQQICSELCARALGAQPELRGMGCLSRPPETLKPVDLCGDQFIFEPGDYAVELIPAP